MPAVAATNPPLLIAMLAAATERIRVGSGGVMLPNHAPLAVAEQFALLEAAYPGRIDLGIGRAPGTDPVTRYVLRGGSASAADDAVARFPEYVADVQTLLAPDGVEMQVGGRRQPLRATPASVGVPTVWLLGSSDYSARLAAERGLPYVFAHHFAGRGTAEALELYRSSYRPSEEHPEPRTFLTVNAAVADSEEEARALALPQAQAMIALRAGLPLHPQRLVEEAVAARVPEQEHLAEESPPRRGLMRLTRCNSVKCMSHHSGGDSWRADMSPEEKLAEMGLTVPELVPPVAAYVPTVRTGNLVFTAGQLPARDGSMIATGKLGDAVSEEEGYECARQCALNALAAVKAEVGSLDAVARIVKAVVFVASTPDFTTQPKVANGASELLAEVFGDAGKHARSAVGVPVLPLDVPVEVELTVEVR